MSTNDRHPVRQITFRRWLFQSIEPGEPGIAPLDPRLGLLAGRMNPAAAEVAGWLAADLPQKAVLDVPREADRRRLPSI